MTCDGITGGYGVNGNDSIPSSTTGANAKKTQRQISKKTPISFQKEPNKGHFIYSAVDISKWTKDRYGNETGYFLAAPRYPTEDNYYRAAQLLTDPNTTSAKIEAFMEEEYMEVRPEPPKWKKIMDSVDIVNFQGKSREEIKQELKKAGFSEEEINSIMK